jgi:hypothetical protein
MIGVSATSRFAIDRSNSLCGSRKKKGHPSGGLFVLVSENLAA